MHSFKDSLAGLAAVRKRWRAVGVAASVLAVASAGALCWQTCVLKGRAHGIVGQRAGVNDTQLIAKVELPLSGLVDCPAFVDHRQPQLSGPSAVMPFEGAPIFHGDLKGDAPVRLDDAAIAAYEKRLPPSEERPAYHVYVAADRRLTFARFAERARPLRLCSKALIVAPPTWRGMDALGPFGALVQGFPGEGLDLTYELRQGPPQSSGELLVGVIGEGDLGRAVVLRRHDAQGVVVYSPVAKVEGGLRLDDGAEAERIRAEVFTHLSQQHGRMDGFLFAPQPDEPLSTVVDRMDRLMIPMCRRARQELDRIHRLGEGIHPSLAVLMSQPVPWVRLTTDRNGLDSLLRASGRQASLD